MSLVDLFQQSEVLIVLKWWAMWQVFDWVLTRLKVKLRKPWIVEVDYPKNSGCGSS